MTGQNAAMTIFESIRNDHETQRTLIAILTKTTGESDGRVEVWPRLKRELVAHAGAGLAVQAQGAADYRRCVGIRAQVGRQCDHIRRPKSHTLRCVAVEPYLYCSGARTCVQMCGPVLSNSTAE